LRPKAIFVCQKTPTRLLARDELHLSLPVSHAFCKANSKKTVVNARVADNDGDIIFFFSKPAGRCIIVAYTSLTMRAKSAV